MIKIELFDKLIIEYNTGPIPPPFCHRYKIILSKDDRGIFSIDLSIEYYDRDEITEEEIFEEGFFLDDNFSWKGSLPSIWGREVEKKLEISNWKKKNFISENGSEFAIRIFRNNQFEILKPADVRIWEIFAHEIIQAIFEISEKESPLKISFFSNGNGSTDKTIIIDFTYSFAQRVVLLAPIQKDKKSIGWEEGQKLLKYIFNFDYLPENSFDKIPKKQGSYISPGDGYWYELTANENANKASIAQINRLIETLRSYG